MASFTNVSTENHQCNSAPSDLPHLTNPEPFCSFCLRERPANIEFYKHVIGSSQEMCSSLQTMLGYEFNLANFAICKPCWKLMQLIQDFRLRCFKAHEVVQRVSRGLSNTNDGWFSVKNLAMIESIRMSVQDQMQNIGKINVTRRELVLDDSTEDIDEEHAEGQSPSDNSENLESEITIGETKVESLELNNSADNEEEMLSDEGSSDGIAEVAEPQITSNDPDTAGNIEMDPEQPEKHECAKCQRSFRTKKGLNSHSIQCGLSLPPPEYFKEHLQKHGTIATFQCTQNCDKLFFSEPVRAHHERICAENARNLACETCGKRFKNRYQLRIHQWCQYSENARIFPCDVCGKMFKQKTAVGLHMKTHSVDKPYGCKQCPMRYRRRRSLNHHVKTVHKKQVAMNRDSEP